MKRPLISALAAVALLSACAPHGPHGDAALTALVHRAPRLSFTRVELPILPAGSTSSPGSVSWVAADRRGQTYLFQRAADVATVVVVDRDGRVVRSWGQGTYTKAHAIRVDAEGNVWTVDAATSVVRKHAPDGRVLLTIDVGGRPTRCMDQQTVPESERPTAPNDFCGTTDVAFAPSGHVFVADGYANDRVLEYGADGRKLHEWGTRGTGAGQFQLPHSITIADDGTVYVADRENGRIQRFDLTGKSLGEWSHLGRVYALEIDRDALWAVTQPLEQANGGPGWLLKLDRATGRVLGYADIEDGHAVALRDSGALLVTQRGVVWSFTPSGAP